MTCHNGSTREDYGGAGIENPHPFTGAIFLSCTTCHGGDDQSTEVGTSHVPPPPELGDRDLQENDYQAYFNRLTLTGIDKLPDYVVAETTYQALDYLQFINPGDLRVVSQGRGCGNTECHGAEHAAWMAGSPMATGAGLLSAPMFSAGLPNVASPDLFGDTAADYGFRAVVDPAYDGALVGRVQSLEEMPELAVYGGDGIFQNPMYDANDLVDQVYWDTSGEQYTNAIIPGTPLADLYRQTISSACGYCHLGSAGFRSRAGDFRSSGCTACHMEYALDGRSRSGDPNIDGQEPDNPDAVGAPELPHPNSHVIRSVARELPGGGFNIGISDYACVPCHQGSNRTVVQFWGIRSDDYEDVNNNLQYPANPATFQTATGDTRLYDPAMGNQTFAGRNPSQYLVFEDYDGDGRDDTPADIHHERDMGCIDCHGSRDVHNGYPGDSSSGGIPSRGEQSVMIACESCHGGIGGYAATAPCVDYQGQGAQCAVDRAGNPLRHVTVDDDGDFWLVSRVTGARHYVVQTLDVIVDSGKLNPLTNQSLYSAKASYAMGRADGNAQSGIGPQQLEPGSLGFAHSDTMECTACHSSWSNNCIGCHLGVAYDDFPASIFLSNITGERIALYDTGLQPVYNTPVPYTLSVGPRGRIAPSMSGMKVFFQYQGDLNGNYSQVLAFSDRRGNGNNPGVDGRGPFGALGHAAFMPHTQRGAVDPNNEGVRSCVTCHLNDDQMSNFGAEYAAFFAAYGNRDYMALDYNLLQQHIGENPGNQLNSPFFAHMVAGLGSGLFTFDADGCPVNPLDDNPDRPGCLFVAPSAAFDVNSIVFDTDRLVELSGVENASNSHPMLDGPSPLRDGSLTPELAGPLGQTVLEKLVNPNSGLILDSWLDADGSVQGGATDFL